jgi:hypothetical protein
MRTLKLIVALSLSLIIAGALVSCVKKIPLSGDQKIFAGKWVADEGTFIIIYNDGGGDFKGSNSSVTGGSAVFENDAITIGMGPIHKTLQITQRPKQEGGKWVLVLDGFRYIKQQ